MQVNRLQLNSAKTELLWCVRPWQQDCPSNMALCIGSDTLQPVRCVHDLGIYIDSYACTLRTVSNCFSALRQRSIRRSVSQPVLLSLVASLIVTQLNYISSTLSGVPGHQLNQLQSVLNTAAPCLSCSKAWLCLSSAPWLALVAGSEENTFSTGSGGLPLSSQHGTSVPRPWPVLDRRCGGSVTTSFRLLPTTDYATNSTSHYWWPFILCDGATVASSLTVSKRQLKTFLFSKSFSQLCSVS